MKKGTLAPNTHAITAAIQSKTESYLKKKGVTSLLSENPCADSEMRLLSS
jgi:hypothetical protein